jgi:branched-chain amino acid aminotransferase
VRAPRSGQQARFVWLDGELVRAERARVSAFDRGFLFGDGVFETLRCEERQPLFWKPHHDRLRRSLRHFAIDPPAWDLRSAIIALLDACRMTDASVRVTVTRGAEATLAPSIGLVPTTLITAREVDPALEELRRTGIAAIRLPFGHGTGGIATGHKTLAYLPSVLGSARARRSDAREALFVEADGTVSEGTTSNLFASIDGQLRTPPLASGCLPGVTRSLVMMLARRAGHPIGERAIAADELDHTDELFVTGSVAEVLPVVRLDGRPVASGRPGELTRLLQASYRRLVRRTLAHPPRA